VLRWRACPGKLDLAFAGKPACSSCEHNTRERPPALRDRGGRQARRRLRLPRASSAKEQRRQGGARTAVAKVAGEPRKSNLAGRSSPNPRRLRPGPRGRSKFLRPEAIAEAGQQAPGAGFVRFRRPTPEQEKRWQAARSSIRHGTDGKRLPEGPPGG